MQQLGCDSLIFVLYFFFFLNKKGKKRKNLHQRKLYSDLGLDYPEGHDQRILNFVSKNPAPPDALSPQVFKRISPTPLVFYLFAESFC